MGGDGGGERGWRGRGCAGNQFLHQFCEEKKLRINKCGKLVVAKGPEDLKGLDILMERGKTNGVPLEMVSAERATEIEPLVKTYERALWSPSTASADPTEVTRALAEDAKALGVQIVTSTAYTGVGWLGGHPQVRTNHGVISAGHVVNCGGLYSDRIGHDFGFGLNLRVLPFKGLYLYCNVPLKTLVYPVPDLRMPFLGVHFTTTVDGKCKIGPTAIPAFWREQYEFTDNFKLDEMVETVLTEANLFVFGSGFPFRTLAVQEMRKYSKRFMAEGAARLAKGVTLDSFTTYGRAGIRAQLLDLSTRTLVNDFLVEGDKHSTHVLNAVSPAWTCSQPFAEFVVDTKMQA